MPRGFDVVVDVLVEEGVEVATTLVGHSILDLLDAGERRGIRFVDTRHELGAAFVAEGTGRFTRRPGVCLVTAGPGLTNAITALASAHSAGVPMVLIAGAPVERRRDMGAVHALPDQAGMVRTVTKASYHVTDPERLREYLLRAFEVARAPRPGPVCVSLPLDVLTAEVAECAPARLGIRAPVDSTPSAVAVEEAVARLAQATRPVVVAGNGAWWADAGEPLAALLERLGAPLFTAGLARGIVPDDHPSCLGLAHHLLNPALRRSVAEADLLVTVGHTLDNEQGFAQPPVIPADLPILRFEVDAAAATPHYGVTTSVVGALGAGLRMVADGLRQNAAWADVAGERANARDVIAAGVASADDERLHPYVVCETLRECLPRDTIWILDAGNFSQWARACLPALGEDQLTWLSPFAPLGCGLGYGIAARLAHPDRPVVVLLGDGSLGLQAMELDTIARFDLPLTVVIGNDAAWGTDLLVQQEAYGPDRAVASRLADLDLARLAEVLGGRGYAARTKPELSDALRRARGDDGLVCIDAKLATAPNPLAVALMAGEAAVG